MAEGAGVTVTMPYGTWPSPLSAAAVAAGSIRRADLRVDGDRLLWTEGRPDNGGRQTLVAWDGSGAPHDLTSPTFNARTRVHEYGGAPFAARDGLVLASDFGDQRLHRLDGDASAAVTPDTGGRVRFADGDLSPDGRWLVCVRETHPGGSEKVVNQIVAIDTATWEQHALVSGRDFVAGPRFSPDGRRLSWLAWDVPAMPWDAAEAHVGAFADGQLDDRQHLIGGDGVSATHPTWLPHGELAVPADPTGFWEIHLWDGHRLRRVSDLRADAGFPGWMFGRTSVAGLEDGRLVATVVERASSRLVVLDPATRSWEDARQPYRDLGCVVPWREGVAFLGITASGRSGVGTWTPTRGFVEVTAADLPALRPGDAPVPEHVTFPTPDGAQTHAIVYLPANADVSAPADERPPLVVFTHGGPTGNVAPALSAAIAYWTTRGFAVADVNYRGSTGYGRSYRDALLGQWGVTDVIDVIAVAHGLAEQGVVDGARMAIRGGSAGGYTTLAVLTSPGHPFACGTSLYGVADLMALVRHTHKFEARYLDQVVGPVTDEALYAERSPLTHVDRLSKPLLVLQGLEDEVVPPEQSEMIVAAAAAKGIPHAYLAFEGEQHGFRRAETIITALGSELAFYGQVMGFTPAGDLPNLTLT